MRLALVLVCFAFLLVSSGTARAERVDLSEFIDPDARAAAKPRNASTTTKPAKKVAIAKRAKASKASKASKVKKTSKQPRKSVRAKRRR